MLVKPGLQANVITHDFMAYFYGFDGRWTVVKADTLDEAITDANRWLALTKRPISKLFIACRDNPGAVLATVVKFA